MSNTNLAHKPAVAQVQSHDTWLRVIFSEVPGDHADFHYRWLRHNCDQDRHPSTRERTVCSSELPEQSRPLDAIAVAGAPAALHITWDETPARTSVYTIDWLCEYAYAYGRAEVPSPPGDLAGLEVSAVDLELSAVIVKALHLVRSHGLAVVRGYGPETEVLIDAFAAHGLSIRGTHFGRIEDLRTDNTTNQNTDQLGYTDYPVKLHTDQPFLENPPRYQLLQCMTRAHEGGENYVVDALRAAQYLRATDRQAYELLARTPVRFHRKQRSFEKILDSPILNYDRPGGFIARYSYFTLAPHRVPFDLMENWYRAYNRFANLVNDPANQYHAALDPGDFLIYDNHRMLHARNGFKGPRWMRGIYFDEIA